LPVLSPCKRGSCSRRALLCRPHRGAAPCMPVRKSTMWNPLAWVNCSMDSQDW
jgi:hypothetical protein